MNVAAVNISVQLFVWIYMFWVFLVCFIFVLIWIDFSNCFYIDNSFL